MYVLDVSPDTARKGVMYGGGGEATQCNNAASAVQQRLNRSYIVWDGQWGGPEESCILNGSAQWRHLTNTVKRLCATGWQLYEWACRHVGQRDLYELFPNYFGQSCLTFASSDDGKWN